MMKPLTWRVIGLAALAAIAVGAAVWWLALRPAPARYVTAPVTRGDVATTIPASGSVNPVVTVQVGTYVSGTIQSLTCDYNTRVRQGQLCAKIDPQPYEVVVEQDQANLESARAQLVKDQADVAYARIAHQRQDLLLSQDSTSRDAADAALNAYNQALAQVRLDGATIAQRAALLKAAVVNLNYTNIVSPVDGTVVSRNVNVGQTVAASFSTPTLFLIAQDLTKMQVDTNVSESDIAGARPGAPATFTVDAFPNQVFRGVVSQVRQAPISVQNVITYDVVVTVANPDLLLKPGMTATAKIVKTQARNVLRVPSSALRFTPTNAARTPPAGGVGGGGRGGGRSGGKRTVWVLRDGKPVAVAVTVGLDDDTYAEIKSGDLRADDRVIVSQAAAGAAAANGGRPARPTTPSLRT